MTSTTPARSPALRRNDSPQSETGGPPVPASPSLPKIKNQESGIKNPPSSFVIRHSSFAPRLRRAFSLIEIIICIALIAMVVAAMVGGGNYLFSDRIGDDLPQVLRTAVREARYQAATTRKPAYLLFDQGQSAFRITSDGGTDLHPPIETSWGDDPKKLNVSFLELMPNLGIDTKLEMGKEDTRPLLRVVFHPDRSCVPFTVELDQAGRISKHRYDPFSDSEVKLDPK